MDTNDPNMISFDGLKIEDTSGDVGGKVEVGGDVEVDEVVDEFGNDDTDKANLFNYGSFIEQLEHQWLYSIYHIFTSYWDNTYNFHWEIYRLVDKIINPVFPSKYVEDMFKYNDEYCSYFKIIQSVVIDVIAYLCKYLNIQVGNVDTYSKITNSYVDNNLDTSISIAHRFYSFFEGLAKNDNLNNRIVLVELINRVYNYYQDKKKMENSKILANLANMKNMFHHCDNC